jgi:hypothetical protein
LTWEVYVCKIGEGRKEHVGREEGERRGKKVLYLRRKEKNEERRKSFVLYKKISISGKDLFTPFLSTLFLKQNIR